MVRHTLVVAVFLALIGLAWTGQLWQIVFGLIWLMGGFLLGMEL